MQGHGPRALEVSGKQSAGESVKNSKRNRRGKEYVHEIIDWSPRLRKGI